MEHGGRCAVVGTVLLLAGCSGDPVVVLGDLPATMRLVAGVPDSAGIELGAVATESRLNLPRGLAVDDEGTVYIADHGARRILTVDSDGSIRELTRDFACGANCPGRPLFLALTPDGTVVFSDNLRHRVMRLHPGTGAVEPLTAEGEASGADGSAAIAGGVESPGGVAVAEDGTIFVSERGRHRVRSIAPDGALGTIAGTGVGGFSGDGGRADQARLLSPNGLALNDGILYIADSGNERVRRMSLRTGRIETVAGSGVRGFGGDGGLAVEASLKRPEGVAVARDGQALFIADAGNNRVRRVDLSTGRMETFAGDGTEAFNGAGNPAGGTALANPFGVAAAPRGFLFIASSGHHVVWRTRVER